MSNYFGFMDETGVLSLASGQRFFALGLLKLEDTFTFYEQLVILKSRVMLKIHPKKKPFEFKFSSITKSSYSFYYDLLNLYFKFSNLNFCCLVFDKKNPDFDVTHYFTDLWDAYLSYSKLLIKKNVKNNEQICIVADYLGKPKSSSKYFENEVKGLKNVYNACMLESHASLFIQIVDVLIGCIAYDYKISRSGIQKFDQFKKLVCDYLKKKLGRKSLLGNFTENTPNYFSVWEFRQK